MEMANPAGDVRGHAGGERAKGRRSQVLPRVHLVPSALGCCFVIIPTPPSPTCLSDPPWLGRAPPAGRVRDPASRELSSHAGKFLDFF